MDTTKWVLEGSITRIRERLSPEEAEHVATAVVALPSSLQIVPAAAVKQILAGECSLDAYGESVDLPPERVDPWIMKTVQSAARHAETGAWRESVMYHEIPDIDTVFRRVAAGSEKAVYVDKEEEQAAVFSYRTPHPFCQTAQTVAWQHTAEQLRNRGIPVVDPGEVDLVSVRGDTRPVWFTEYVDQDTVLQPGEMSDAEWEAVEEEYKEIWRQVQRLYEDGVIAYSSVKEFTPDRDNPYEETSFRYDRSTDQWFVQDVGEIALGFWEREEAYPHDTVEGFLEANQLTGKVEMMQSVLREHGYIDPLA